MAPVGSYAALAAAVRAGANSVYFGVDRLNMRARAASPFHLGDLRRIARICRWCGVRSYLTLNTLVYDEDMSLMREICAVAADAGVDAVIATDIAAIECVRDAGLEVHISVQANISNIAAVRFYSRWADVVVLARELTLEQIANISSVIRDESITGPSGRRLQIEMFAHGALCVAISGKCYMSLGLYNTSANRGACYQTCRRKYRVTDVETGDELEVENNFVMSPKDLCTIQHIDKLVAAGVEIFKLEGRGRSANYVSAVTRAYREALDAVETGTYDSKDFDPVEKGLQKVFNRGFWSGGYYCGAKLGEWSGDGHSQATRKRVQLGVVSNFFGRVNVVEFTLWQEILHVGEELLVEGSTTGAVTAVADELRVDGGVVNTACKGDCVTFALPAKARRGDKVFLLEKKRV